MRFDVLATVKMSVLIFWFVVPCVYHPNPALQPGRYTEKCFKQMS